MLVLLPDNVPADLNLIPSEVDMNFCVLDNSDPDTADYFFPQLIMLESFYAPTLKLKIGEYYINVPADFQLLIGEPAHGNLEVNSVTSISGRDFKAFSINPLSSFTPNFLPADVDDILPTTRWYVPKLRIGELLCVPLCNKPKPPCIFLTRDMPKSMEVIRLSDAW